jgi:3-oxoacyl-[acyl-carrier protein] reductase
MGNILILGASGSIAYSLIDYLGANHKIKCIDNNLENAKGELNIAQLDVSDSEKFREYLALLSDDDFPECLINLCGQIVSRALLDVFISDERSMQIDEIAHLKDFNDNVNCQAIPMLVFSEELIKRKKKGKIVNFSSVNSKGAFGQFGYSSAKSTIESMSRSLALEVGIHGIQVNCISPGHLNLPNLTKNMNENGINRVVQQSALKRLVDVNDVCLAVDFLLSTSGVSGTTLHVHSNIG